MRRFFPIFAAVVCLLNGCSREEHKQLIVGMELKYPPFEMVDTNGAPTGVSVDLANALGKYLGREVTIENIPFDGLIPSLQTHKIDLIISSMTATAERAKAIDFSDHVSENRFVCACWWGRILSIQSDAGRGPARENHRGEKRHHWKYLRDGQD